MTILMETIKKTRIKVINKIMKYISLIGGKK